MVAESKVHEKQTWLRLANAPGGKRVQLLLVVVVVLVLVVVLLLVLVLVLLLLLLLLLSPPLSRAPRRPGRR